MRSLITVRLRAEHIDVEGSSFVSMSWANDMLRLYKGKPAAAGMLRVDVLNHCPVKAKAPVGAWTSSVDAP
jgi:hypothetical protein